MYRAQGSKYIKCNELHKTEHHHQFAWCCKANFKINPPRLKMKQSKLCLHSFKCINYKGDYQADSNVCSFWKHRFNREWHSKKYQELQKTRMSRLLMVDLTFIFHFSSYSIVSFFFSFLFYFQNNLGQGLSVTLSHQSQS